MLEDHVSALSSDKKIGGEGLTVEIDESKFGKRKYNKGKRVEGQWVFGGICRETGDFFTVPVERRDADTLLPIIKDHILPGTTINIVYRGDPERGVFRNGLPNFFLAELLNRVRIVVEGSPFNTILC